MDKVSLVSCGSYDYELVQKSVFKALDLIGGAGSFVSPGMRVLIKPNLLKRARPEANITTHPAVVAAIAQAVREAGATAVIAESPGGPYNRAVLKSIYEATGMAWAAGQSGAELNYGTASEEVYFAAGRAVKKLLVIKPAIECDAIISAAKLKTHELMAYTGAVKNLFGIVPGITKAEYHYRMQGKDEFADMLVDIAEFARPVLSVIDAIEGMEGEGPSSGRTKKIGALIAACSPHAADLAAVSIIGLRPDKSFTLKAAAGRGLVAEGPAGLEILGESIERLRVSDFETPSNLQRNFADRHVPAFLSDFMENHLKIRPVIPAKRCVMCGVCMKNCPAGAIRADGRMVIDYARCINCFCCHELCPEEIVKVKRPLPFKIATGLLG